VINPEAYGPDVVEWAADVTDTAFRAPAEEAPSAMPADPKPAATPEPSDAKSAGAKPTR
jgi:hypothetical protein